MAGWFSLVIGLALVVLNKPFSVMQNTVVFGSAEDAKRLSGTRIAVVATGAGFAALGVLEMSMR